MEERKQKLMDIMSGYPEGYDPRVATDDYLRAAMRRLPVLGVTRDKAFFKEELEKSIGELDIQDEEEKVILSNQVKYLFFILTGKDEYRIDDYVPAIVVIIGRVLSRVLLSLLHYHEELDKDINDGAYGDIFIIVSSLNHIVFLHDPCIPNAEMFIITALNTCMTLARAEIDYGDIMGSALSAADLLMADESYSDSGVIETIAMLNMLAMQHPSIQGNKEREKECVKRVVKCNERLKNADA